MKTQRFFFVDLLCMCSRSVRPSRRDPSGPPSGFCCSLKVFLTQVECQRSEGVTAVQVLKPSEAAAFVILCTSTDLIHQVWFQRPVGGCSCICVCPCICVCSCTCVCVYLPSCGSPHWCVCSPASANLANVVPRSVKLPSLNTAPLWLWDDADDP